MAVSPVKRVVLLNDTSADLHHGCALVTRTIEQLTGDNGLSIVARSRVHEDWRADAALRESMAKASLILVNGEGTIHHDRPAGSILLEAGPWAAARGIPAALINATWQSNGPALLDALRSFALISVRESASAAEIAARGLSCRTVPDLALWHDWPAVQERSGILVTDSVVPAVTAALDQLRTRVRGEPLSLHYGSRSWRTHLSTLRRHGVGDTLALATNMRGLHAAIAERRSETSNVTEFMRRLASCRLLITGRFHAFILALATETPVLVAASNTHKIAATLRDAGLSQNRIIEPGSVTPAIIDAAGQWSPEEQAALHGFTTEGRTAIRALFEDVRRLAI